MPKDVMKVNRHRPPHRDFRRVWPMVVALIVFMLEGRSFAQAEGQQLRTLDEPFREKLDQAPLEKRALFDWGGWYRFSYWQSEDDLDRDADGVVDYDSDSPADGRHMLRRHQMRLWGFLTVDQAHTLYIRGLNDYYDWNTHTSYRGTDHYWDEAQLERGWYHFRYSRLPGVTPGDFDLSAQVGRQYVELGTGLALSYPLDALLVQGTYQQWQLTGLLGQSMPSAYNLDRSFPGDNKECRTFMGGELGYTGWKDHRPFVYLFNQQDHDDGAVRLLDPADPTSVQSFGYNSWYLGFGSRGRFFHRDVQYTSEMVFEGGESHAQGILHSAAVGQREDIKAWALDSELRYISPGKHSTQLLAEYLLTSGDGDRSGSSINTVRGNIAGSDDKTFGGWGYRNTGIALVPLMSNLGMIRFGVSSFPLPDDKAFENMQLGADVFLFHKQEESGALSSGLPTEANSEWVGTEVDVFVNWRLASDLAWSVYYGLFEPGDTLNKDFRRQIVFTAVTLNF